MITYTRGSRYSEYGILPALMVLEEQSHYVLKSTAVEDD